MKSVRAEGVPSLAMMAPGVVVVHTGGVSVVHGGPVTGFPNLVVEALNSLLFVMRVQAASASTPTSHLEPKSRLQPTCPPTRALPELKLTAPRSTGTGFRLVPGGRMPA